MVRWSIVWGLLVRHMRPLGRNRVSDGWGEWEVAAVKPHALPVSSSRRPEWTRILFLIAILAVIVLGATLLTTYLLYSAAIQEQGGRLLEIAQSQARTIEAMARHELRQIESGTHERGDFLEVLIDAHEQYAGFGKTGEFTLAQLEDDHIVFLLSHRHFDLDFPEPVPINSELAEPMRRALRDESGTVIGLDYRGELVLAAYEPVADPDYGIVAKIDLREVRTPYYRAAAYSFAPALAAIILGAWLFTTLTRPMVLKIGQTEQRFQTLVENMQDGLGIQDENGIIRYANDQFCRIVGRPLEEVIGHRTDEYMTPASKDVYSEQVLLRRQGNSARYESTFFRPDGSLAMAQVAGNPVLDEHGRYRGSFAVMSEITHLKEIETQLRVEKEQAQRYLDVAGVMLVALDVEGCIELINRRGVEILGYSSYQELIGRNWFDLAIPEDGRDVVRDVFRTLTSGEIEPVEYYENAVQTNQGDERILAWHNVVVKDSEGNIIGTLSSGNDITEQRKAEQERLELETHLRQSQKLESIGTLASGVAHEINNPLTGIINYAELIRTRTEVDKLREFADGIVEEGERVAEIVKALLSFAREEKQQHSPANIRDIVDSSLTLTRAVLRKDQIRLIEEVPSDLPLVRCRSQQIQQVLLNLINNARDALNDRFLGYNDDKILRIEAQSFDRDRERWIRLVVEDHGRGIPQESLDRIFDPFFSTKPREAGTGLGLSISYGIVREHHGQLLVESEPNEYTRFIVELRVENGWRMEKGMEDGPDVKDSDR